MAFPLTSLVGNHNITSFGALLPRGNRERRWGQGFKACSSFVMKYHPAQVTGSQNISIHQVCIIFFYTTA